MNQEANPTVGNDGPSPIDGADWDLPDDVLAGLEEEVEEESEQEPEEDAVEEDGETDEGTSDEEDEDDAEADDEVEEEESAEETQEPVQWDGNPDTLPEQLKPAYTNMVRGYGMKMEEVAALRKELQAAIEAAKSGPAQGPQEDGPPPAPTFDDNEETFNAKQAALTQWHVRKAIEAEREKTGAGVDRVAALERKMAAEAIAAARAKEEAHPDHSPAVMDMVQKLVDSNPMFYNQPETEETIASIFELARDNVELAKRKTSSAQHKATAPKRAITRPGKGAVKKASPKEVFAKGLDEAIDLAVDRADE